MVMALDQRVIELGNFATPSSTSLGVYPSSSGKGTERIQNVPGGTVAFGYRNRAKNRNNFKISKNNFDLPVVFGVLQLPAG